MAKYLLFFIILSACVTNDNQYYHLKKHRHDTYSFDNIIINREDKTLERKSGAHWINVYAFGKWEIKKGQLIFYPALNKNDIGSLPLKCDTIKDNKGKIYLLGDVVDPFSGVKAYRTIIADGKRYKDTLKVKNEDLYEGFKKELKAGHSIDSIQLNITFYSLTTRPNNIFTTEKVKVDTSKNSLKYSPDFSTIKGSYIVCYLSDTIKYRIRGNRLITHEFYDGKKLKKVYLKSKSTSN